MPATSRNIPPQAAEQIQQSGLLPRANPSNVCLPVQLLTALPNCSINCIQSFISNNYAGLSCSATANLNLLCSTKSSGGLTIGEGSLQCVISNCQGINLLKQSGYTICSGVPGALLNMAETITATINPTNTGVSPTVSSESTARTFETSILSSSPAPPPTSKTVSPSPIIVSTVDSSIVTAPLSSTASPPSFSITSQSTQNVPVTSGQVSSTQSTMSSATFIATAPPAESTTSATAMTAGQQAGLSTSAIAGIATAGVVVAGLLIGYMAYLWIVRRKEYEKRRSKRFSTWLPPQGGDDERGPETAFEPQNNPSTPGSLQPPPPIMQERRRSLWTRSTVPPTDIGVAVAASTRVSPEPVSRRGPRISWPSPSDAYPYETKTRDENRWSKATSFDEGQEAQNQDVPILGSARIRSSARSFSTISGVDKPAPLRLSKVKPRAETPPSARILLTPVYDNGTFEPTIRRVYDDRGANTRDLMVPRKSSFPAPNFSRREPSLTRSSREQSLPGPWATKMQSVEPLGGFQIRPTLPARKASVISDRSVSIYTDIEEDDTPEQENDRQLGQPQVQPVSTRSPLKDLRYPQIPQSAVISKQAQKPHSPRAGLTTLPMPEQYDSERLIDRGRNYYRSTSSSDQTTLSISPVFPMPPGRTGSPASHRRTNAQSSNMLARQISDAYKAASRSTTTTTPRSSRPGEMYQQIQRLSTGRPLARNLGTQGLTRQTTNRTPRSGDLYFTVPINTSIYGR